MADEIKDVNEGYTEFGGTTSRSGGFFLPTGPLGRFFARFFASTAQKEMEKSARKGEVTPEQGDTVITTEVIKEPEDDGPARGGIQRGPGLPKLELNRKQRYKNYEEMDQYPEIGSAFDIYADDSTQRDPRNNKWLVKSKSQMIVDEVERFFESIHLDRILWDITRNTVKYGDCFVELVLDVNKPKEGLKKVKILNPNFLLRVENEFGYLRKFLQQIPNEGQMDYGVHQYDQKPIKYVELDKNQIVHFRLHTSDPQFYPYGKSVAAACHHVFRSMKMMEDAMMIYRISRAPERRVFYVDTGNLPTSKAEMFIERMKDKFKKEKFYNNSRGTVDARYNPMSMDEDYFVPTKAGKGTKIDTLPGAQNLGEIEDVRYFRDKLLAALKVPKDYIVEKDKSPERKANLSQLDVKFARVIDRVQINIEAGLENMAKRHLQLRGYAPSLVKNLRIKLPEPSDMSAKRKLDLDEQKIRVVQAVKGLGLFSSDEIYKQYYDMTDAEIKKVKADLAADTLTQEPQAGAPGAPSPPPGAAGGQEPAENTPPTANESKLSTLEKLMKKVDQDDDKIQILERLIKKQKIKAEESPSKEHI